MPAADLLVHDIGELVTLAGGTGPRCGKEMGELGIERDAAVAVRGGKIVAVGPGAKIRKEFRARRKLDAGGRCVTPGLVDSHTHLVFAGSRADEFEKKIEGVPYMDIAAAGGGINATVKTTRKASKAALAQVARTWIQRMAAYGTTTAEVKSGYGLTLKDEIKQLEVVRDLSRKGEIRLVPTFLGAHETPPEHKGKRAEYVRLVVDEMIPEVARRKLARFCDVFCEVGVFSADESRRVLAAAKELGMAPKLHAEEFKACGGAELAAEMGAVSADHLTAVTDRGIRLLRQAGVIAVLLPGTSFFLGTGRYARARKMIEEGMAVALASDFNPGSSMSFNLPLIMSIACTQMRMTPAEALCAVTRNAAHAVGLGDEIGTVEEGKAADLVVWDAPDYRHIPYIYGVNLAWRVLKAGKVLARDPDARRVSG
ncbi:MAG: imidazolonepropionase [Planctomycetota bacterium]